MRIKTFQGRSIEELLPEIRAELGAGAVVLGQRTKVNGGIGGFFGTKVVEVTAADRMPGDEQLVELEDQMMRGELQDRDRGSESGDADELADRFAGAMRMGRRGGLDVTDTWDPSQDAELASEYGRVLQHAAASGFSEMEVPVVERTAAHSVPMPPAPAPVEIPRDSDPIEQARALAERAHGRIQHGADRVDAHIQQHAAEFSQTYAPPAPLPRATPAASHTFSARVEDPAPPIPASPPPAAPASPGSDVSDALAAAVDMVDLKAMAALRNAMHASRRLAETERSRVDPSVELEISHVTTALTRVGVDEDVCRALADIATRHRLPFGGEQNVIRLMRALVEESIDVRSGFPSVGRAYRIALVGPSSSGKSTVAAKLAAGYRSTGLQVGIVSILTAGATDAVLGDERLQGLDVDVRYVATPEQAANSAEAFQHHDLVIVDTPGSTYLDPATYAQVQSCLLELGVDDVHVVVPLTTSSREATSIVEAYRPLGANRLIASRLDESKYIGQLVNFGFRLGVPMTFLSDGPRIPDDLRAASAREIADLILPTEHVEFRAS